MIAGLAAVGLGGVGGFVGWFVGIAVCPDFGDLGIGALPWATGGAVIGAAVGAFVGAAVVG